MARDIGLVSFDVDRIKEFVFAGHRPLDATGASEMVKDLSEDGKLLAELRKAFPSCTVIYANGGSGLLQVDHAQVDSIARRIEDDFRRHTLTGSCSAVSVIMPETGLKNPDVFQRALKELGMKLRLRKLEKAAEEPPEAWTMGYFQRCQACGVYPSAYSDRIGGEDEYICESCKKKRSEGRAARHAHKMAESLQDIAGRDREYVAVIYADVNNTGKMLLKARSSEELREFSKHLWQAATRTLNEVIAQQKLENHYQSPIVGGDDLVVFVPANGCLQTFQQLWNRLEGYIRNVPTSLTNADLGKLLGQATLSLGLLVASHHLPVPFLFNYVEALTKNAKRLAYERNGSAVDFLLLKGGSPFSERIQSLRAQFLERHFTTIQHFPVNGRLTPVRSFHLTMKPYLKHDFEKLYRDATEVAHKDLKGQMKHIAAVFENAAPMEALFHTLYQVVRTRPLQEFLHSLNLQGKEATFFLQTVKDVKGTWVVQTGLWDMVELLEMMAL